MALVPQQQAPAQTIVSPHVLQEDPTNNAYFLPSNEEERVRLALQHNLVLKCTGGKQVHAPIHLDKGCSVLESGTGSGIWLLDLAKAVPQTTELIGIDIKSNLFPKPMQLPPNVQLQVHSVLDLPDEWTNKFDFVHQRFLVAGLREAEWVIALREIYCVLKPGGWLQLFEVDDWEQSGPKLATFCRLFTLLAEAQGIHGLWPYGAVKWQRYVEDTGFVDIRVTWHSSPMGRWAGQEGLEGKENMLWLMRGVRKPMIDAQGFGFVDGENGFDGLIADVERELDSRQGVKSRYIMICGQKPFH